jgi:hypothetical protein
MARYLQSSRPAIGQRRGFRRCARIPLRLLNIDAPSSTMASSSREAAMVAWNIGRDGRAWGEEAMDRYYLAPEKIELIEGQLFGTEEERLTMLALLLENVGADKAVRLGDAAVWRAAIDALDGGDRDRDADRPRER